MKSKAIDYLKNNWTTLFTILVISISAVVRVGVNLKPCATGDGVEYVLMTEALYNHLSPEIRPSDCESFKKAYIKKNAWETNDLALQFDFIQDFVQRPNKKYLDDKDGFFVNTRQNVYSYHFFFYSLLNTPARTVAGMFSLNPLGALQATNALVIIISCLVFFKTGKFSKLLTSAFCLLFYFSTTYWYIGWAHPEIFTICFLTMGLWYFYHEKQYTGIVLITLAALQNQPLAILVATLCIVTLFKKGLSLKTIFLIGLCSVWVLLPSLFYYVHFNIANLVAFKGFLNIHAVTSQRVFGFFFDLNQGMVLAIPLIIFIYIFLILKKIIRFKKEGNKWDMTLFLVIIAMTIVGCTMIHWNHGQAVVNRYVTYISATLIVHFFFLLVELTNKKILFTFLLMAVLSQIAITLSLEKYNDYGKSDEPKGISNWVLEHCPEYYNPDPQIFFTRYMGGVPHYEMHSPAYYMKENGEITKYLVYRFSTYNLIKFGYTKKQIDSIEPHIKFVGDWGYINVNEKFKSSFSGGQLIDIDIVNRIELQMVRIKGNPLWYEMIKQKAKDQKISDEDALRNDAAYVLNLKIPERRDRTEAEKIADKIREIHTHPNWIKLIDEKAKEQKISLDSAILNDATYMVQQEELKKKSK